MSESTSMIPQSLRPWSDQPDDSEALTTILGRIYEERGHFRNITEDGLKAEIAAQEEEGEASLSDEDDEEDKVAKDSKTRPEELQAARREMIAHVASAQNEAMLALDFVSLLLSKDLPRQAEMTMSPVLKQQVKPGTLGMDMWQNMPRETQREQTDAKIAKGWMLHSLQKSADSLLDAASRLESNVRRETEYWKQVLSVSEKGWSVCRMPRERHNLGVRYGFSEASGEFGRRGLAALRADSEGHVVLDRGFGNNPKSLRVRVVQDQETLETSHVPVLGDDSEFTIEARIRHARDSLYEEELFHEVLREARSLFSYGVRIESGAVRIPVKESQRYVLVDLIQLDNSTKTTDKVSNSLAQAIAMTFRLLLSHTHRQRLQERSKVPAPLSLTKADAPIAQILRPVMAVTAHDSSLKTLALFVKNIRFLLSSAGIETSATTPTWSNLNLGAESSMETLMTKITKPLHSDAEITLTMPVSSENVTISINLDTAVDAPLFGSRFTITSTKGPSTLDFDNVSELTTYLSSAVASELARASVVDDADWKVVSRQAVVVRKYAFGNSKEGGVQITIDTNGGADQLVVLSVVKGEEKVQWTSQDTEEKRTFWEVMDEFRRS